MRIQFREAQKSVEAVGQLHAVHVLQLLRDVVDLIPIEAQMLHQKALPQPVAAEDVHGNPVPGFRELNAVVALVLHPSPLPQLLEHGRGARRRRGDAFRQFGRADLLLALLVEVQDGLEVILDADRGHGGAKLAEVKSIFSLV